MQADDQSDHSPHFLSLDNDVSPIPLQSAQSTRYNSFNMRSQTMSNSQEKMLFSLPSDYISANNSQPAYKSQTKKVIKRQAANVDDSSLSSQSYSYQESSPLNSTYNNKDSSTYNRYPFSTLESSYKVKDYLRNENCQYREGAKENHNNVNYPINAAETHQNSMKKKNSKINFVVSPEQKHDKRNSALLPEELSNSYLCETDLLELDISHVTNIDSSGTNTRAEKLYKTDIIDSSASKLYESMSKCSNNVNSKSIFTTEKKIGKSYERFFHDNQFEPIFPNTPGVENYDHPPKVEGKQSKTKSNKTPYRMYDSLSRCSNEIGINNPKIIENKKNNSSIAPYKMLSNQYTRESLNEFNKPSNNFKTYKNDEKEPPTNNPVQENSGSSKSLRRRTQKVQRRHTTEYRGPMNLALPPLLHDSSDSAERSPVKKKESRNNYPYFILSERKFPMKTNSITSSTSDENSDIIAAAIKKKMQTKEWRDNKAPRQIDSFTVDRRTSRKNATKSAKIKRRGSLNIIDPIARIHPPLQKNIENDISCSMRNCNTNKSPLLDARKAQLQISAEDMVQIANCGARNKNGSLCHFIDTNNKNQLSISQAILDQSSSGGDTKTFDSKTINNKYFPKEKNVDKKKSTHSLVIDSSGDLCSDDPLIFTPKRFDIGNKGAVNVDLINKKPKHPTKQHSNDLEKPIKSYNQKREYSPNGKSQSKSESQRSYKLPINYYHLENENISKTPVRKLDNIIQSRDSIKIHNQCDISEKRSSVLEHNECRCLTSNHSLTKADGFMRDKNDSNKDSDHGNMIFRHFGALSREEIDKEDVEETFDF